MKKASPWLGVGYCLALGMVFVSTHVAAAAIRDSVLPLPGGWRFAFDHKDAGVAEGWFNPGRDRSSWRVVPVPHTWQVEPGNEKYFGVAWYARTVTPEPAWQEQDIRLEFDAVYRDATVYLNGEKIDAHTGSGYTPFQLDLTAKWKARQTNEIVVRVDNRFSPSSLPYERSFDWPNDGGIIRAVRLRVSPPNHLSRLHVTAQPSADFSKANIQVRARLSGKVEAKRVEAVIYDPAGDTVLRLSSATGPDGEVTLQGDIAKPALWHFDQPRLYRAVCRLLQDGAILHERETSFGIRRIEVTEGQYVLNGEPMRLMGVEWMPGSDPRYGMAEEPQFMSQILADMKRLNCVLTRFHWQQDESVFDFCDREGMLLQEEVPTWGRHTLSGPVMEGLQEKHLREMIAAHFNHPSIYAWGVCNEIDGHSAEGQAFVRRGRDLCRALDPGRLVTYAANTLQSQPEEDAARLLDFVEWNEYYESWYKGTAGSVSENLLRIQKAFPGKGIVISEYGLCECNTNNPVGEAKRIEMLHTHTDAYRHNPAVAGAIYFDYNDYRTHIGDKGQGAFQQRVHGVVDLLGNHKGSWEVLRQESSPVRSLRVSTPETSGTLTRASVEIVTRSLQNDLPAYTLRNYLLVWVAYNKDQQPIGTGKRVLADLPPGSKRLEPIDWPTFPQLARVRVEIFRPTGYSTAETEWKMTNVR